MSLQSANLNNGVYALLSTTFDEMNKKLKSNNTLYVDDRGLGSIYWKEVTNNTFVGATTIEPPDLIKGTKTSCPSIIYNNIFSCASDDVLSLHDVRLKRRVNRLDIEWEIEKDFDESDELKEFIESTKNKPQFIIRHAMPAAERFRDKYDISIRSADLDENGMMKSTHYDYANRYVVGYEILGITNDDKLQLYYVQWYDKPSLMYIENELDEDKFIRLSSITLKQE